MTFQTIGKLTAMLMLGAALTACVDITADIEVTSETTAKTTLTQVMGADFYAMAKTSDENTEDDLPSAKGFCVEGVLTENPDGSATCVLTEEGTFADLTDDSSDADDVQFTPEGTGLVRVTVPALAITNAIGNQDDLGPETKKMVEAYFAGRTLTVRISGGDITDTNMTLAKDGKSAEQSIPFLDIINGTADLTQDLYAVVRTP